MQRWETAAQPRPTPTPTARGVLTGLGLLRCTTALWAVVVAVIDARSGVMQRPALAATALAPMVLWSAVATWLAATRPITLLQPAAQGTDLVIGAVVVAADWAVYDGGHSQSLGSAWVLAPVISTGVAHGPVGGLLAGLGLGLVNTAAAAATRGLEGRVMATVGTTLLLALAGATSGWVMERLRRAEDEVGRARPREDVSRTLHDGVLQTLAAVQRRSTDHELVALAEAQDHELRAWLQGAGASRPGAGPDDGDFLARLRRLALALEQRDGVTVEVVAVVAVDPPPPVAEALLGAAGEAVTNATKHAAPSRVTVFVDSPDAGAVLCTVHDDGNGFDPATAPAGMGLELSVRRRVEGVGGSVTIRSAPGRGTDVEMTVP